MQYTFARGKTNVRIAQIENTCTCQTEFLRVTPTEAAKTSELQCKQMTDEPDGKVTYSLCDYSCPRRAATPYVRYQYAILRPKPRMPSRRHGNAVIEMDCSLRKQLGLIGTIASQPSQTYYMDAFASLAAQRPSETTGKGLSVTHH
jgi:hypothetical protein